MSAKLPLYKLLGDKPCQTKKANEEEAGLWSSVALSHLCLSISSSVSNSGYDYLISQ